MNNIRQITELNKRELENGVSTEGSWHAEYRDTAYVYVGGLPFELSEGDLITIFSQYGEPTFVNIIRDKDTGKSRGFAFLKYEDQRSTDLAVDNLGGTTILGRTLRVDHTRYQKKDDESEGIHEEENPKVTTRLGANDGGDSIGEEEGRPMLKEERDLARLVEEHDEDDPMKAFLVQEKKEQVAAALASLGDRKQSKPHKRRHHHHHKSHRSVEGDHDERTSSSHTNHREDKSRRPYSRDVGKDIDRDHGTARRKRQPSQDE